jgi:hypothetical protein
MSSAASTAARANPPSDLAIEQWVREQYGFVPHPAWISHCKELYLAPTPGSSSAKRLPRHECPPEKRLAIKEAFVHFGLLAAVLVDEQSPDLP